MGKFLYDAKRWYSVVRKLLEVKDLCKEFDGKGVLSNVSFFVNENEILGLIGKSGAGKMAENMIRYGLCLTETAFLPIILMALFSRQGQLSPQSNAPGQMKHLSYGICSISILCRMA